MKHFRAAGNLKQKPSTYIIDSLVNNLEKCSKEYEDGFEKFGFSEKPSCFVSV
jgi:hypothetical protein